MKPLAFFSALLCTVLSFGQHVQLTVQTGHSATISDMCYSHDDNFIITAGQDNKIIVWDIFTSKQYSSLLGHDAAVTGISLHPNGEILVSSSLDSTIRIWNIRTEECEKIIRCDSKLGDVCFKPDGSEFIAVGLTINRFSYPEYKEEELGINARDYFTSVNYSSSGNLIGIGGASEKKGYVYNDSLNRIQTDFFAKITEIKFDHDESSVFYTTTEGHLVQKSLGERSYRYSTTSDFMLNSLNSVEFTDSLIFISNDHGEIQILDKSNWRNHRVFIGSRDKITKVVLSSDGKFLACAGANRSVVIWDLEKRAATKVLKGLVNRINTIAFSEDGEDIIVGYADGEIRKTNLITNQSVLNHLKPKSKNVLDMGSFSVSNIQMLNGDTAIFEVLSTRRSLEIEGVYDKILEYTVSWDIKENLLGIEKKKGESPEVRAYIKDLKRGVLHLNQFLLDKNQLSAKSQKLDVSVSVISNEVYVDSYDGSDNRFVIITGHSDLVSSVAINERYGFLATASWDGMIRFWDLKNGDLLTIFGAFGKGQYVYLNSDNYYFSSKNALNYIGFKFDDRMFSFDQFDLKYNRPDMIVDKLPYFDEEYKDAYFRAYKKRLSKLGVKESDLELTKDIPHLEVTKGVSTRKRNERTRKKGTRLTVVDFHVEAHDELANLDKLHVKVNGVPEFGILGKPINQKQYKETISIRLNPGKNYIQFSVINEHGISSFISSFTVNVRNKEAISNLYVISLGSSKFRQSQYDLGYAAKDAEDIANYFSKRQGDYDQIFIKKMVNEQIRKDSVVALKSFLKGATENDVVILFAAGHGVLDAELDYYFSTYNMDFNDPSEKGIPYDVFENLMSETKSRKKVMFLDACHSGEIDKDEVIENFVLEEQGDLTFRSVNRTIKNINAINSFDLSKTLFADMRMNSGTTVISSAGGAQYAIEGEEWDNGVFTYALINGLENSEADLNKDRSIQLSELQEFILFEVNKLTNGMQTPTSRAENLKNDFVIH
ncbi:caspase family protein [Crocinitomix catalasitica]|nr:caspase family protein [Crocinitomix catalasitica]